VHNSALESGQSVLSGARKSVDCMCVRWTFPVGTRKEGLPVRTPDPPLRKPDIKKMTVVLAPQRPKKTGCLPGAAQRLEFLGIVNSLMQIF